mmetsp:Transcript_143732/g.400630  ORF Transcript_143732/g.400630 Transcript_143732/m.400630 type:complete len:228 (+) Transcript_143732:258-941(+)
MREMLPFTLPGPMTMSQRFGCLRLKAWLGSTRRATLTRCQCLLRQQTLLVTELEASSPQTGTLIRRTIFPWRSSSLALSGTLSSCRCSPATCSSCATCRWQTIWMARSTRGTICWSRANTRGRRTGSCLSTTADTSGMERLRLTQLLRTISPRCSSRPTSGTMAWRRHWRSTSSACTRCSARPGRSEARRCLTSFQRTSSRRWRCGRTLADTARTCTSRLRACLQRS